MFQKKQVVYRFEYFYYEKCFMKSRNLLDPHNLLLHSEFNLFSLLFFARRNLMTI